MVEQPHCELGYSLSDDVLLRHWQSVQGPRAQLTDPLIRFAALIYRIGRADVQVGEPEAVTACGMTRDDLHRAVHRLDRQAECDRGVHEWGAVERGVQCRWCRCLLAGSDAESIWHHDVDGGTPNQQQTAQPSANKKEIHEAESRGAERGRREMLEEMISEGDAAVERIYALGSAGTRTAAEGAAGIGAAVALAAFVDGLRTRATQEGQ